jgi:hypothetical protein
MCQPHVDSWRITTVKRRDFLTRSALALLGVTTRGGAAHSTGSGQAADPASGEPIIDIHQHLGYSGRPDDVLLAHQRAIGATTTILLPAGRAGGASTHGGLANGLQAEALGNEACYQFVQAHRQPFLFGANDVPDLAGATQEIERYLKRGAVVVAEQKFGVECDSPEMQRIYALARAFDVPVLMHWQFKMYNYRGGRRGSILSSTGFFSLSSVVKITQTSSRIRDVSHPLAYPAVTDMIRFDRQRCVDLLHPRHVVRFELAEFEESLQLLAHA